jgi:predicted esterase
MPAVHVAACLAGTARNLLSAGLLLAAACCNAGEPAATANAALVIAPGTTTQFRVVLPENLRRFAGKGKLSPVTTVLAAIAVPDNFDPKRPWPMLIVSPSSDRGYRDARAWMRGFVEPALAAGWVVFATDPAEVPANPLEDDNELRFAMIEAAEAALAKIWPDSAHWPLAFGGFSGGSKRSGVMAFLSTLQGRTPIGMFLGGCNEATPASALDAYGKPVPDFLRVPVYLSSGKHDKVATPAQHAEVELQLAAAGFKQIRLESNPGPHDLYQPQVREALEWFAAQRAK